MKTAVVTGASSGLGKEIVGQLWDTSEWTIFGIDKKNLPPQEVARCHLMIQDLTDDEAFDEPFMDADQPLHALINCAGINRQNWFQDVTRSSLDDIMAVNVYPAIRLTQNLLPNLKLAGGVVVNIVSNAAWIPMTASLGYNMSKAALEMVTKQMAHELTKLHNITVLGIAPNKLAGTGMSKDIERQVCQLRGWSPEYAQAYQLKALLTGKETEPRVLAEYISWLIQLPARYQPLSGCIIPFGK